MMRFLSKMSGGAARPPGVGLSEIVLSWMGAFLGVSAVALVFYGFFRDANMVMMIGSFGASAVLVFGGIRSPLAQPRNLVGGHVLSAVVGVAAFHLLPGQVWLAAPLGVATAIGVMQATKTLHPPGGATALIAVVGGSQIHDLGYSYAIAPVGLGAIIMLAVALVVNNIPHNRKYPEFWY